MKHKKAELLCIVSNIAVRLTNHKEKNMFSNCRIIQKNGKNEFVVIPYDDFLELRKLFEDYEDLIDLRKAKTESENETGMPLDGVMKELNL